MSEIPPNQPAEGSHSKSMVRKALRDRLAAMSPEDRHRKSQAACAFLTSSPEFQAAHTVMIFLSMPLEVDTAPLALKCWQAGKTVVAPKVSWDQRRMLPVEIASLHQTAVAVTGPGVKEPVGGKPVPINLIDLVIVPGLGFTPRGYRIGRGMGFYDRFLSQPDFGGFACGLAFEDQVLAEIPLLDHDVPLSMLATDQGLRRFATKLIQS
jgi:5-formyltetrahydrofolate cyclo-ligase